MGAVAKSSKKSMDNRDVADLVSEAKKKMLDGSEKVIQHFNEAVSEFSKSLKSVVAESQKVAKIGGDLYSYLEDRFNEEEEEAFSAASEKYGSEMALRMNERGDFAQRARWSKIEDLSIGSLNSESLHDLGAALGQLRKFLASIPAEIRNIDID